MTDESVATVHQGAQPIDLGRDSGAYKAFASLGLADHKLGYGLLFLFLVGASILYVSLGASARNDQNNSSTTGHSQTEGLSETIPSSDSINVNLNSNQTSTNGQTSTTTKLNVNGQDVPVEGGNVHKTFTSDNGSTTIKVNQTSTSSSTGGSN